MVVFGVYLLYQNFLVTFVSISDNLLSLSVMITIIFSVRFPELGLFLVELSLVVLLLLLLLALAVQIRPHVLFLFSSEFLVLGVLLLLSRFLKTHVLVDLHLFLLDHLFLFLHDSVVLLIDELESFLFTTGQFFLTRFFLFVQQSAIIILGFNIPLFFLVLSDHGNMLVDFVFFFESFEMLDALDLPLQLETLGLLFFLLDPMDQNGVQLFLSFFFISFSSGFIFQLSISAAFLVLDLLHFLLLLLVLTVVEVGHLQLEQLGVLLFLVVLHVLHQNLLLDLFLQLLAVFLFLFFGAESFELLFLFI